MVYHSYLVYGIDLWENTLIKKHLKNFVISKKKAICYISLVDYNNPHIQRFKDLIILTVH